MPLLWFTDINKWRVRQVECPNPLRPFHDIEGNSISDNTHYANHDQAVTHLVGEVKAFVELAGRNVTDQEHRLMVARLASAEATKAYALVAQRYREAMAGRAPTQEQPRTVVCFCNNCGKEWPTTLNEEDSRNWGKDLESGVYTKKGEVYYAESCCDQCLATPTTQPTPATPGQDE